MFTRAGFNARHRVVVHARVHLAGYWRPYNAQLLKFVPSGDLAWYSSRRFLVWGDKVRIETHDDLQPFRCRHGRAVDIDAFHRKLEAAREAGCLAIAN